MALLRPVNVKPKTARQSMLQTDGVVPLPDPVFAQLFGVVQARVICGEETKYDSGTYISYVIVVRYGGQEWQVARRFRMFEKLHAMLQGRVGRGCTLPDLPKTHMLRKLAKDYVQGKAMKLDTYLQGLLKIEGCANSPDLYNFLFKSRYTVGVRASFIGVPESDAGNTSRMNAVQTPPSATLSISPPADNLSLVSNTTSELVNVRDSLEFSPAWEDDALIKEVAPPGSELASFLETNKAEIEEHESCIRELLTERKERIGAALREKGEPSAVSLGTQPLDLGPSTQEHNLVQYLAEKQEFCCSTYGTTAAAVAALKCGFILVNFPSCGTELAVCLKEAIGSPSATSPMALSGTTTLNGSTTIFEGKIMLGELKGQGFLRLVSAS